MLSHMPQTSREIFHLLLSCTSLSTKYTSCTRCLLPNSIVATVHDLNTSVRRQCNIGIKVNVKVGAELNVQYGKNSLNVC